MIDTLRFPKNSSDIYSSLVDMVNVIIIVCDNERRLLYINDYGKRVFHPEGDFDSLLRDLPPRSGALLKEMFERGMKKPEECSSINIEIKNGELSEIFKVDLHPLSGNEQTGICFTFQNTTALVEAEVEIESLKKHIQHLIDLEGILIICLDKAGRVTQVNTSGAHSLGYPPKEILQKEWFSQFVVPGEAGTQKKKFENLMEGIQGDYKHCQTHILTRDSQTRLIAWYNKELLDAEGKVIGLLCTGIDITEKKEIEEKFMQKTRYLKIENSVSKILNSTGDMDEVARIICSNLDLHGFNIATYSQALNKLKITGSASILPEVVTKLIKSININLNINTLARNYFLTLSSPDKITLEELYSLLNATDLNGKNNGLVEELFSHLTKARMGDILIIPLKHSSGSLIGILMAFKRKYDYFSDEEIKLYEDITDSIALGLARQITEQKIHKLAYFDDLTKLTNQKFFKDFVNEQPLEEKFSIFSIKVRDFSRIISSRGEKVGDETIIQIANKIKNVFNRYEGTLISRPPGVAFFCYVKVTEEKKIKEITARLMEAFTRPIVILGNVLHIRISIGICVATEKNRENLFQHCNIALEKAREKADKLSIVTNNYEIYTEKMTIERLKEETLEEEIRFALAAEDCFLLHYQPKVTVAGKLKGFEALIRWNKNGKLIFPNVFIPKINEMGLSDQLFSLVLKNIFRTLEKFKRKDLEFSVNISPEQFADLLLISKVRQLCSRHDISPQNYKLKFEIIETDLVKTDNIQIIRNLKALGFKIAIDDFGSGYSNLKTINNLATSGLIDEIKIDKSLIDGITNDPTLLLIILEMARKLEVDVVAEGVETPAQYSILKQHYPDTIIQGWFFSKALPYEELPALEDDHFIRIADQCPPPPQ